MSTEQPQPESTEGWKITFGQGTDEESRTLGVVAEFEPDYTEAERLYKRQVEAWVVETFVNSELPGYLYSSNIKDRWVRMERVSREAGVKL